MGTKVFSAPMGMAEGQGLSKAALWLWRVIRKAGLEPWRVTRPTSRTAFSSRFRGLQDLPSVSIQKAGYSGGRAGIIQSFALALENDPAGAGLEPGHVTRPTSRTAFESPLFAGVRVGGKQSLFLRR